MTVDARDPHTLAGWWAAALGWEVARQDESFIRRMIADGHTAAEDTIEHRGELAWREGAAIVHPEGTSRAPRVYFQRVPEDKVAKNRVHLDLRPGDDDVAVVVERLTRAAASSLHEGCQGPHTWVTLADPEANEFCVSR